MNNHPMPGRHLSTQPSVTQCMHLSAIRVSLLAYLLLSHIRMRSYTERDIVTAVPSVQL